MKTLKLKGELDSELKAIGLKAGDTVHAEADRVGKTGAMYFTKMYRGTKYECVVWPQNYVMLSQCSWCGKMFEGIGFSATPGSVKIFCSDSCHKSDYEQNHDNFFSDADSGL